MWSNIDLIDLSKKQKMLDEYICYHQNNLSSKTNLTRQKLLAFLVELGEYANEERSFKYWSQKPPAPLSRQLDEYVDGLHFLLSLGNDLDYHFHQFEFCEPKADSLLDQYFVVLDCFHQLTKLWLSNDKRGDSDQIYAQLINAYFGLGHLAHYSKTQVLAAYSQKNQVNFARQNNHY